MNALPLTPSELAELEESLNEPSLTGSFARDYVARLLATIEHTEKRGDVQRDVTRLLANTAHAVGQEYAAKERTSEAVLFMTWHALLKAVSS